MKNKINKKGAMEEMVKILLWVIFFVALSAGVYFLIKNLIGT